MKRKTERADAERNDAPVLDFGLKFGGILTELGNLSQDIAKMAEDGKTEITRTGEISLGTLQKRRAMYGVSVRMGGDGMPQVDTFGRRPESDIREPIVDIFDEPDRLQVIVELPGVEEDEISVELRENTLAIRAGKGERKYKKKIDLGSTVQGEPKKQYKNGILEINLRKA